MIAYYRLFDLLNRKGYKKKKLLEVVSTVTAARLAKNMPAGTDTIDSICKLVNCQPSDIMEYIPDEE